MRRPIPTVPLMLALAVVILTTAAGVLWFMNEAMANQRLASRQRLTEAYRNHLLLLRDRLDLRWERQAAALDSESAQLTPAALFARALAVADSAVCYGADGQRTYPAPPTLPVMENSPSWVVARQLEDSHDLQAAAKAYAAIGSARAKQAQARCLLRSGQRDAMLALVWKDGGAAPQTQLLALESMTRSDPRQTRLAQRLHDQLASYDTDGISGGERLFLMRQLIRLHPEMPFRTLTAEELAARFIESANLPDVWRLESPQKRVTLLFRAEGLASRLNSYLREQSAPAGVTLSASAAGDRAPADSLELASFPGWRIGIEYSADHPADAVAQQRTLWYLWIGCLAIAGVSVAAVLLGQSVRRQVQLAGVKADLVATVSHELKTPLSSMRLLVDTLLEQPVADPVQTREYLQLISCENARLSHLIEQFLTFSRMERRRHVFDFADARPDAIARSAVDAMRDRLRSCEFQEEIAPDLPAIRADAHSLVTALVNLLDNACKYSPRDKRIALRVFAVAGRVRFAVEDHGIGIPSRETRKIFRKFYQADQALSRRAGGVGLGLSIVRLVVEAHRGAVEVESHPGEGSTFTISLAAL